MPTEGFCLGIDDYASSMVFTSEMSLLRLLSENCKERQMELSWEEKAKVMVAWYKKGKML